MLNISNNLPMQLTSFVGREREIAEVRSLLRVSRLLTLTGAGGSGKTRLALQVVSGMLDEPGEYQHGIYFVSLAPISDPGLVISSIAETLDIHESPGQPLEERLKAYLHDKRLLLLLDNFEQIVEAATQVVDLLKAAPDLKMIVTSRTPLQVSGEQQYKVQPLTLPDPSLYSGQALGKLPELEVLSEVESVSLFVQRVRGVKPQFTLTKENSQAIAEICHRLDGLPLAIELAAARLNVLTPQQILGKLKSSLTLLTSEARDIPTRHQTLRSAIEWSYTLLNKREAMLFRRMSIFVGGYTLEAAEAICNASGDLEMDMLDCIASLVDKSLLKQEEGVGSEPRFVVLETIREYALERVQESVEAHSIRQCHARFYLTLVETLNKDAHGPQQAGWLDRLETEYDNIRAALQWSQSDEADPDLNLRLVAELGWYWFVRGRWGEGRSWLRSSLSKEKAVISRQAPQNKQLMDIRARALSAAGRLALKQGDYNEAESLFEECLMLRRKLDDQRGISGILIQRGNLALAKGDISQARTCFEESLVNWRQQGDKRGIADALSHLALAVWNQGDLKQAREMMNESIRMLRELGDTGAVANALQNLAQMALDQGEYSYANTLTEESINLAQELGMEPLIADAQLLKASLALQKGDYNGSRENLTNCLTYYHEASDRESILLSLTLSVRLALAEVGAEEQARQSLIQTTLTTAARLLGAIYSLRVATGTAMLHADQNILVAIKAQLGEKEFHGAWEEGQIMTMEQAIAYALDPTLFLTDEMPEPVHVSTLSPALGTRRGRGRGTSHPEGLTRREVEVLRVVAQGLTNAQIAEMLFLSPNTVNVHLYSIYSKLGVNSRSAATRFAIEQNLG